MIWMDVDTAVSAPANIVPLVSDSDFKTVDETIAYNESGMLLYWHFVTTAGTLSITIVTPTAAGTHDWDHTDHGMYMVGIPASGGANIDNDREGFGYFTGVADNVLPFRGPTIGFRAVALNNALIDGGDNLDVNVTQWLGTAPLALSSQRVQVDVQAIEGLASAATVLGLWLAEGVQTVADSGTTTTLVDAVLTQADDYWNGAMLIFRSGTNEGRTAIITDFDAGTDTLTFTPAVPDAVTTEGYVLVPGLGHADITAISHDATAADNLEAQFDGTGYVHDTAPATQLQLAGLSGGMAIQQFAEAPTVAQPPANGGTVDSGTYESTQSHDGVEWVISDSEAGEGINFYLQFDIGGNEAIPVACHLHGWFEDPGGPSGVEMYVQAYNFNSSEFQTVEILQKSSAEQDHIFPLTVNHVGTEASDPGIVRIRFRASASAAANKMRINHCAVDYVNGLRTDADGYILLSSGTGTGQLSFTSGVVDANLTKILGTALTETSGYLAAGFKKFFNIQTPLFTTASVNQSGDSFGRIGATGSGLTSLASATNLATLTTTVGTAGAGLSAVPWNSSWDAEVESEVNDALVALNLDHLMKTAVASGTNMTTEVADGTVLSNLMTETGDTSDFVRTTDSLEAIGGELAGTAGAGAISWQLEILDDDSDPIDGVEVWISTDNPATNIVAGVKTTNAFGLVTFMLDAGTYYVWRQRTTYNFDNPQTTVVA